MRLSEVNPQGTGDIILLATSSVPTGWLLCNGSAVSRTTYAKLFEVIGTQYGVGDGSTTFNLPDIRGEFVRGFDFDDTLDFERQFGSPQLDQLGGHVHPAGTLTADAAMSPHTHPTVSVASAPLGSDPAHTHPFIVKVNPNNPGALPMPSPSSPIRAVFPGPGTVPLVGQASSTAPTPHSHTGSANAANMPHAHPGAEISGSGGSVGGVYSGPAWDDTANGEEETRPRNLAFIYVIKG